MTTVNAELYDFLREHETGLYINKNNELIGFVFIDFWHIEEFIKIVGSYHFDGCDGLDCKLQEYHVCVELNEIIEAEDQELNDYKNCFIKDDWNYCNERLKEIKENK
jgi:hypothetical protein